MSLRSRWTLAAAAAALAFGVRAWPADLPPAMKELVEQARKEGQLNISWSSMGFNKGAERFEQGFNAYYGLKTKFNYTPGLSFVAATKRIADELAANKPAFRDLSLIAGAPDVKFDLDQKIDRPIDWAALLPQIPKDVLARIVSPEGRLIRFLDQAPTIMYNTNIVKAAEAPKSLADLANPKWKGMLASTPFVFGWEDLPAHPAWPRQKALDLVSKVAQNVSGLIRCADFDRISSGEFPIFALVCEPGLVRQLQARGAPVDQNIPQDWRMMYYWSFGVPRNAQNPATATLFIAWVLTPEGQRVMWENEGADLHLLPGSRNRAVYEQLEKSSGGPMVELTWQQEMSYSDPAFRQTLVEKFRNGSAR
ncbi:MAG: ABC transporter substrate-binding protein [Myxococcales bacterium]